MLEFQNEEWYGALSIKLCDILYSSAYPDFGALSLLVMILLFSAVKAWLSIWKWSCVVLSSKRLDTRNIQIGRQIKFILKIIDIFVDILPSLKLLFIHRKYACTFEVDQQYFSGQFYRNNNLFQCITAVQFTFIVLVKYIPWTPVRQFLSYMSVHILCQNQFN